jgi:hypothetical protein
LDNANYFALQRQYERLSLPAWEKFADMVKHKDPQAAVQLRMVSDYLQRRGGEPQLPNVLPLSLDDVDRANRWLAEEAVPGQSDLTAEADICRQTLAKIRELQPVSISDQGQPVL